MAPLFFKVSNRLTQYVDYSFEDVLKKPDGKSDPNLEVENRFRSIGIGESIMFYMHLYPNRWDLVNLY